MTDAWVAKEKVRSVYATDDPDLATQRLDDAIAWCTEPEAGPELRTLAKTLRRWRTEIIAHHHTGASNGRSEAANRLIKQVKRAGRGFRNSPPTGSALSSPEAPTPRARLTPSPDSDPAVPG